MREAMAILIAGPTASGKSALALALAERFGGVVINADSMQVYRDLSVLTARPTAADEARAPHALYGFVDAADAFSAARWVEAAAQAIACAHAKRRVPIVVGGTGLYMEALTEGFSEIPPIPPAVRERWRTASSPARELHAVLAARDPLAADRIRPSDPQRIVRALEVWEGTGRSILTWQGERSVPVLPPGPGVSALVLAPDRTHVRRRIEERFDAMLAAGALSEVAALRERRLDPSLPAMKALGVEALMAHLDGRAAFDEARAQAITRTRQYAKRQDTFLRNRFAHWRRAASAEEAAALLGL